MRYDATTINAITEKIIGCAFRVHQALGRGFLEKVYENAMVIELREAGLSVLQQQPVPVYYKGQLIGDYVADLVVEGCVIVELKAVLRLVDEHSAQGIHYLSATGMPLCLLLNFGKSVDIKRLAGPNFQS